VPSFAAAAALRRELTIPKSESLVLTRISGRASKMPPGETLAGLATPAPRSPSTSPSMPSTASSPS
jgi:precorrin-4 methylase